MPHPPTYDGNPQQLARWRPEHDAPPSIAVWEITLRCNLGCCHCGSRAARARPDELSTTEALDLVRQFADLGLKEVTLIGGEHHAQHTHNMDFFLATPIAVMDGLRNCGTGLLEPMLEMRLSADETLAGKLIGDILAIRGETRNPVIAKGEVHIEAFVPVATSMDYPVAFASLTSGRGKIRTEFCGYRECPLELGATTKRRGVDPLDRAKWILSRRGAV